MQELPVPIPTADQKAFVQALKAAVAPLQPNLPTTLDDLQRKSLYPRTMGPESVSHVEDAAQLIKTHPQILPRTITDGTISEFEDRIQQFRDYTTLLAEIDKLVQPLRDARLLVGVHLRSISREAQAAGRRDDGKTPGVAAMVAKLDAHTARAANDDDTPPTKDE